MTPIHILGAGPAGLAAAIALAKEKREVHVHERYDEVGKRFHGDFQGLENWSSKTNVIDQIRISGIEINFKITPFQNLTFTNGKNSFNNDSKEPLFYLVKRGTAHDSLDSGLYKQAQALNIHFHFRSKLDPSSANIIATGPIRQALCAIDKGVVFQTDLPNMAIGIFHDSFAHLGYSYLLVADGQGCLCSCVFKDFHCLNECFEHTKKWAQANYSINLENAHPVGGNGSFCLNSPKVKGSALLVGEAAGLQDLLWGFGIRSAINSGLLAAQSIIRNQDYTTLIDQSYNSYMKASIVNRFIWEKIKYNSIPLIPFLLKPPYSMKKTFHFLYQFTPFHRLLYPFALRYVKKHYNNSIEYDHS